MEQNELVKLTGLSKWFEVGGGFLRKPSYVQAVEGVSLANTHREEFGSVIRRQGGVDGLLKFMRGKRDGDLAPDVPR